MRGTRFVGLLLTLAAATLAAGGAQATVETDQVVDAAVAYVSAYTREFAFLLADETAAQTLARDDEAPETRTTTGELFLTYLAADRRWIAVHDVAAVDGVPVADRSDLQALLGAGSVRSVAAAVAAQNARYNLGRVVRNFNEPTLALQILDADRRPRSRFRRQAILVDEAGRTRVTVSYEERERPTLVSSLRGGPVHASGTFDIDAATGRIHAATMHIEDGPVTADLETTFRFDRGVALWVPAVFTERYRLRDDGRRETTHGVSRYDNYRRFDVSGRLLIGPAPRRAVRRVRRDAQIHRLAPARPTAVG